MTYGDAVSRRSSTLEDDRRQLLESSLVTGVLLGGQHLQGFLELLECDLASETSDPKRKLI